MGGRPSLGGRVAVTALATQDVPTGIVVGALGSTAYVLAVGLRLVRDVPGSALRDVLRHHTVGLTAFEPRPLASQGRGPGDLSVTRSGPCRPEAVAEAQSAFGGRVLVRELVRRFNVDLPCELRRSGTPIRSWPARGRRASGAPQGRAPAP